MTSPPADDEAMAAEQNGPVGKAPSRRPAWWQLLLLVGVGFVLAVLLYYPVGAWRAHVIDDDLTFAPADVAVGQSKAVATAAQLIRREIDGHGWTPNKPFFLPASILVSMPSFQRGMAVTIERFVSEMALVIGRPAGDPDSSPELDPDLARAAELMHYPADVWMIDPAAPWARTLSTEKQYRNAARGLESYNQRLLSGNAAFDREPTALRAVLDHLGRDLDDAAANLEEPIVAAHGWFGHSAAEVYYINKGKAYADLLLLRALGEDCRPLLAERGLGPSWQAMLATLTAAAAPRPWVILNGGAASTFIPNHLASQGYYLMRARARLSELSEALR
ncbi:DUF2333 domain-containing protein [Telmatospirillum sp.]|uniref:DUF2333 domain-containing protein n=1 Tax=Telmatospirillum sp. TaxID=2079197 RepID=UPI00284BD6E2|nr:DUF2333 domain-containing protein [Telmatospirillum sp.]MDR3440407.1 DUF2333 domain-containing protein [Telmatospirillum sp.]